MATTLTFHGQDGVVELDDATLTLTGAETTPAPGPDGRSGHGATTAEPVVVLRSDVASVDLQPPTLLAYGRLTVTTRSGARHTLQFPRDAQSSFEDLKAIIRP